MNHTRKTRMARMELCTRLCLACMFTTLLFLMTVQGQLMDPHHAHNLRAVQYEWKPVERGGSLLQTFSGGGTNAPGYTHEQVWENTRTGERASASAFYTTYSNNRDPESRENRDPDQP